MLSGTALFFTGTTRILEGTLKAVPRALSPDVVNAATLELDDGVSGEALTISAYSGSISGVGALHW